MGRRSLVVFVCLVACGGEAPAPVVPVAPAPAPPPAPVASAPATPAATAAATAAAIASAAPSPAPSAPAAKGKQAFRWNGFPGPAGTSSITTRQAWAPIPIGLDGDFGSLKVALLEYGRPEGDTQVLIHWDKNELFVPAGMVHPAEPAKGVAKGSAVMANVAAASAWGRVTAVEKGDDGRTSFKIRYEWGGSPSDGELTDREVIKLEDKVAFGHPVAFKAERGWSAGQLIYTDKTTSWVIGWAGRPAQVATADVRPILATRVYKKGEKVLANRNAVLEPARVLDVIEGGISYKVRFDEGGAEGGVALGEITAPF